MTTKPPPKPKQDGDSQTQHFKMAVDEPVGDVTVGVQLVQAEIS